MEKRGGVTGSKTRSLGGACRRKAGVESQHLVGAYLDGGHWGVPGDPTPPPALTDFPPLSKWSSFLNHVERTIRLPNTYRRSLRTAWAGVPTRPGRSSHVRVATCRCVRMRRKGNQ